MYVSPPICVCFYRRTVTVWKKPSYYYYYYSNDRDAVHFAKTRGERKKNISLLNPQHQPINQSFNQSCGKNVFKWFRFFVFLCRSLTLPWHSYQWECLEWKRNVKWLKIWTTSDWLLVFFSENSPILPWLFSSVVVGYFNSNDTSRISSSWNEIFLPSWQYSRFKFNREIYLNIKTCCCRSTFLAASNWAAATYVAFDAIF